MMEASCHRQVQRTSLATTLKFLPGSTIRWRATRFIVVDYADLDALIARELGKRNLERIPLRDAKPDRTPGDQKAWMPENELAR
jgi:hypothetical protein